MRVKHHTSPLLKTSNRVSDRLLLGTIIEAGLGSQFQEFYGRMTQQGKEMIRRALKARKVHHSYVG
jgi:hypothetical protein